MAFADGDRECGRCEGKIHTNVDEYRLLGWGRDLYFLWECVGLVRARWSFRKMTCQQAN